MSPVDRPVRPEGDADNALVAQAWHDVTCPEGPDCRSRWLHSASQDIVNSGHVGAFLSRLAELRAASAAPETSPAKPPLFLTSFERDYVQALNAILGSRGEGADVHRWRGHAEALRQVCERIRRDLGLPAANYTTESWRARNGVYQQDYLDSIHRPAARAATPTETTEH